MDHFEENSKDVHFQSEHEREQKGENETEMASPSIQEAQKSDLFETSDPFIRPEAHIPNLLQSNDQFGEQHDIPYEHSPMKESSSPSPWDGKVDLLGDDVPPTETSSPHVTEGNQMMNYSDHHFGSGELESEMTEERYEEEEPPISEEQGNKLDSEPEEQEEQEEQVEQEQEDQEEEQEKQEEQEEQDFEQKEEMAQPPDQKWFEEVTSKAEKSDELHKPVDHLEEEPPMELEEPVEPAENEQKVASDSNQPVISVLEPEESEEEKPIEEPTQQHIQEPLQMSHSAAKSESEAPHVPVRVEPTTSSEAPKTRSIRSSKSDSSKSCSGKFIQIIHLKNYANFNIGQLTNDNQSSCCTSHALCFTVGCDLQVDALISHSSILTVSSAIFPYELLVFVS